MSTIDPTQINTAIPPDGSGDPQAPVNYLPETERGSKAEMQTQFENAKNDVEALEATAPTATEKAALDAAAAPSAGNPYATIADVSAGGGHIIQDEGSPVATPRPALNFVGTGVSLADNAGNDSTDVSISFIDASNVGVGPGSAGVFRDKTLGDPAVLNYRSLVSSDASVVITELADTVDLVATGGGAAGQINSAQNIGGGLDIANEVNNGLLIPIRSFDPLVFQNVADQIGVIAGTFADDTAAQSHYGNTGIHFSLASLPGAGLIQVATALAVGQGDGVTVSADDVAVDATVARSPLQADLYSDSFRFRVGAAGLEAGYLGAGVGLDVIGSSDGATVDKSVVVRGAGITVQAPTGDAILQSSLGLVTVIGGGNVTVQSTTGTLSLNGNAGVRTGANAPQGLDTLSATALYEGAVRVYSPNNPPPAGDGDVTGPASAVSGNLAVFDGTTGKIIQDGGPAATGNVTSVGTTLNRVQVGSGAATGIENSVVDIGDVARLSQAQTFSADQTIAHAATTRFVIESTDSVATFELFPGDGLADQRRFGFVATSGSFFIFPLNDLGSPAGNELTFTHTTGVLDASGLTVGGTAVLLPDTAATIGQVGYDATPTEHASAGDLTISYTVNQFFRVSGATTFAINVPVDGSLGAASVSIPNGTTVSLVGWTVSGTEPTGVARVVSLMSDENGHFARW